MRWRAVHRHRGSALLATHCPVCKTVFTMPHMRVICRGAPGTERHPAVVVNLILEAP